MFINFNYDVKLQNNKINKNKGDTMVILYS